MKPNLLHISPVIPSQDIKRDIQWYEKYLGFACVHHDEMYAVMTRENQFIHLQWHADTEDDPLLGGSVIKLFVEDIMPVFEECVKRGTIVPEKLRTDTMWNTHEFGFFDLNENVFFCAGCVSENLIMSHLG